MKFGNFILDDATGLYLAHSMVSSGKKLRKGHLLIASDIDALRANGVTQVSGAQLATDDVDENTAAALAAKSLVGTYLQPDAAAQGRCNLRAQAAGLLQVNVEAIIRLNLIDETLTLATLPPSSNVRINQVVATVKCIPLAVNAATLKSWQRQAEMTPSLTLAPYRPMRVAMICSRGSSTTDKLLTSTEEVTRRRVEALGGTLISTARCAHDVQAVHKALVAVQEADLILITGAAVSKDRGDTVPSAIVAAGGKIVRFGMPVEPGNMLLLGQLGSVPIINLPGCARSPRTNGLDWVMQRLAANLPVSSNEIASMGAGGLLLSGASANLNEEV